MTQQSNAGEGADPSSDLKKQNPEGTTTADLVEQGGDQDPAAPSDQQGGETTGDTKVTGPGQGPGDDVGLSHSPSGG